MRVPTAHFVEVLDYHDRPDGCLQYLRPKQVNQYLLHAKIGSGASSSVYVGEDLQTKEKYAVKRIRLQKRARSGDSLAQFEREIRLMRQFSHPNIIRLVEVLHIPSTDEAFLVLEYAENGCLGSFLERNQSFSIAAILSILKQMLSAVKYLHDSGYVHQDIKPWNILLAADGRAILADFGIAHSFGSASMVVGSPAYQAPEALDEAYCTGLEDCENAPQQEDVWALGVTFYELLFQRLPFVGTNLYEIVSSIQNEPLMIPEGTAPMVSDLLNGMLTIDPAKRVKIDDLIRHPLIVNAPDRVAELPPVPPLSFYGGPPIELQAVICPIDF
jgi:serine/threonine-protein kinase 11